MKSRPATKTPEPAPIPGGILCGTDFSPAADVATEVAAAIARKIDAPLLLAHAVEIPETIPPDAKALRWLTASRGRGLRDEAERIRETGVNVEARATAGRADEVLVNLARKGKSRMIVVSSLGRRRPGRWLLGSVAERTAERADVPTLVLRHAGALRAWARGQRTLKVFVCFNFTATSEAALRWVRELTAIGPCEVVLGYVNWPIEEHVRLGGAGPLPFDGNPPEVLTVLKRDMKARARVLLNGLSVRCRVEAHLGRTDARLAEMAKEEGADLIVVGSHQYEGVARLWHASVSRGLLGNAAMSVAVVPLATDGAGRTEMMPALRHVLVSTDFSDLANRAIPYAYSLLRGGGVVSLLHVLPPPPTFVFERLEPGTEDRPPVEPDAGRAHEVSVKLHALIPAGAADQGVLSQVEVVESHDVGLAICQAAERLGADVICLGSHGHSGLSTTLLGSVAEEVMKRTRRPLFVVRPPPP